MNLQSQVIKTLSFFDIFSQPLTFLELKRWLWTNQKITADELLESLKGKEIKEAQGFFFLDQKDNLVDRRLKRELILKRKITLAKKAANLLSIVPFIKVVALCNSVSFGVAVEESDIDLLIITEKNKIWTVRFFVVLLLKLFGLYRQKNNSQDKVCASFFLTTEGLNLENITLAKKPDIYLVYWVTQLIPLINREKCLEKFWQENAWINKYLVNIKFEKNIEDFNLLREGWERRFRILKEIILRNGFGDMVERFFRYLQLKKMSQHKEKQRVVDSAVIVNDKMLKFHEEDRRILFQDLWLTKIKEYGLEESN